MKATIIHLFFFILPLLDLKSDLILVILPISLIMMRLNIFYIFDHLFFFHELPALFPTWYWVAYLFLVDLLDFYVILHVATLLSLVITNINLPLDTL